MHNEFKTAFIRGPEDFTHNREGEVLNHYRKGLWTVGESRPVFKHFLEYIKTQGYFVSSSTLKRYMEVAKAREQDWLLFYSAKPEYLMDLLQYESFRDSENSDVALKLLSEDDLAKYERRHIFECAKFWKGKTFYTYEV